MRAQLWGTKFKGNAFTKHGHESEPKARDAYKSRGVQYLKLTNVSSVEIEQRGLIIPLEDPRLGDSSDGMVTILEIKSPLTRTFNSVDDLPPDYTAQVNRTMGCFMLNDKNILLLLCAYAYIFAYTQV